MLRATPEGVRLYRDWSPKLIGKAIPRPLPRSRPDDDLVQAALLGPIKTCEMEPIPVPVLDTLEKLVTFLNR